jgi:hypothetical protein
MTPLDNFLPEVIPYVPGCPQPIAINAVRNALIELCDKSYWSVYEADPLNIVAGTSDYELDSPTDTDIAGVIDVMYNGYVLQPAATDQLRQYYGVDWRTKQGSPRFYTRLEQEVIRLVPNPDSSITSGLSIIVATKPCQTASTCDDDLFEKWKEGVAAGAVARLALLPQQGFTNPRLAEVMMTRFMQTVSKATIDRNRGSVRTILQVVPGKI